MIVTLDYETTYLPAQKYSLTNMSTVDYLLDPRYETIMCAMKKGAGRTECEIGHRYVAHMLASVDWPNVAMLSHNAQFDASILYWKYGYVAGLYLDTVAMARALTHPHIGRSSLAKVAEYLGLPPKGTEVVNAANKTLSMFTSQELYEYMRYCKHDCDLAYQIFQRFIRVFPKQELSLIDQTVRMFVDPQVKLNPTKLSAYSFQLKAEMDQTLSRVAGMQFPVQATKKSRDPIKEIFSSNPKFAAILEDLGVEVPMKISPTTGSLTWALAKNDRGFKELCDDASQPPEVQAVLAARLGVKSTIDQTRTDKLFNLSCANWPAEFGGPGASWMPAPLSYGGAHTLRWSGSGGFNLQNIRRGSPIKDAIEAPPGMRIVHRDSSQIEARMVCWLARAMKLLMAFQQKRDVYSEFGTGFYKRLISKHTKQERQVSKVAVLQLGYGSGIPKFNHSLYLAGLGADLELAKRVVNYYRFDFAKEVPKLWHALDDVLERMCMMNAPARYNDSGTMMTNYSAYNMGMTSQLWALGKVFDVTAEGAWFPDGLAIQYPKIRKHTWMDDTGRNQSKVIYNDPYGGVKSLWGGSFLENISQRLACIVIKEAMKRIYHETKYHPFLTTHDSLDYCVPEGDVQWWDAYLEAEFERRPSWAPDLPLASEGGWGKTLLAAEDEHHICHNQ
jgi:DNA polymerase